jgi:hypothetical protein
MQVVIFTLSLLYHDISGRKMDIRDIVDIIMGYREVSSPVLRTKHSSFSTCATEGHLLRVTIPDAVLIQFDLQKMCKILLETCKCRGL